MIWLLRFWLLCGLSLLLPHGAFAQGGKSEFVRVQFSSVASIEVPRNWTFLDQNLRQHLNTNTEATLKLSGLNIAQGDNRILVAANAYSSNKKPSATMRLSVRRADSPTQDEMRELVKLSKAELQAILAPAIADTKRTMLNAGRASAFNVRASGIVANGDFLCTVTEFEITYDDGKHANQTYVCPFGDKRVKLTTSYRISESSLFRPVTEYVWRSLRVP
jgi:hypothetical protein